jgi:hypothetical protein
MSTSDPAHFVGLDVGATRLHAARIRADGEALSVVSVAVLALEDVPGWCASAVRAGVDGPAGLSAGAHAGDTAVAPKFRGGRCSEVPVAGYPPVSWVTPSRMADAAGWMRSSFAAWASLHAAGIEAVEVFPAACFHRLNGRRWPPPKTSAAGRAARLELLGGRLSLPAGAAGWGHDHIDAVAAALVAAGGRRAAHRCPRPDGSVMWVPE